MNRRFKPFPVLSSERLVLRQLSKEDAPAIYVYQSNKNNFPYVEMKVYEDVSEAENYIKKMNVGIRENQWIVWAICLKNTSQDTGHETIIGTISIWNLDFKDNKAELGYGIFPEYRRLGYMREALTLVQKYGFETMQLNTLEAYTSHSNKPSFDLLTAMEFDFIHTIEDAYSPTKALMDVFSIKNPRFEIRVAKSEDIDNLEALIQKVLIESNAEDYPKNVIDFMCSYYSKETIQKKFNSKITWVLEEKESEVSNPLGTISLCEDEIQALFVDAKTQGKGYGRQLLEVAEAYAKEEGIDSLRLSASLTAKIFYEKMNYEHVELEDDPDFGQAYLMTKKL